MLSKFVQLLFISILLIAFSFSFGEPPKYEGSQTAYKQFVFAYTLLQRAQRSDHERDWKLASGAFDDFLGRYSQEGLVADALYYRALIAHLQNDHLLAAQFLVKAKKSVMVGDDLVQLLRGQVAVSLNRFDEVLTYLARIKMANLDKNVQVTVWLTRAACHQKLGQPPKAVACLESAVQLNCPLQARALLELGQLQASLDKLPEALDALDRCLALNDEQIQADAAWLSGDLNFKIGRFSQAIDRFQLIVREYPTSPRFEQSVVDLMWTQLKSRHLDTVIETFRKYRDRLNDQRRVTAYSLAASAHQQKDEHVRADVLLQAIATTAMGTETADEVLYKLALSQFELAKFKTMARTIGRLQAEHPDSVYLADAEFLLAKAAVKEDDINEAAARFTNIIQAGRDHPYFGEALHQRAWLYESRRELKPAIEDYRHLLEQNLAASRAQAHEVALRLVNLYSQIGRYKLASDQARNLLGIDQPQAPDLDPLIEQEAIYRWGWAQIKIKQFDQAHEAFAKLLKKYPLNRYRTEAMYYDGLVLLSLDREEEAVAALREALRSDQLSLIQRIESLRLSAQYWRRTNRDLQAAEALIELDKLVKDDSLQPDEFLWLGRYLHDKQLHGQAIHYLKPLIDGGTNVAAHMKTEALYLTARCLRRLDKKIQAVNTYRQVIAMGNGFDLEAWLEKADTLKESERYDEALEEYAGLINVPQTRVAAQAMFHSGQTHRSIARNRALAGNLNGAKAANEQARLMFLRLTILHSKPEISPLSELARIELAEIEYDLDQPDAARATYEQLAHQFPDTPYGVYAWALLELDLHGPKATRLLHQLRQKELDPRLAKRVDERLRTMEIAP